MSPRKAAAVPDSESLPAHLVAAAERLIARQGAAGLTVRAIAKEARVADGVLYNHFADKEELIARALRAHVRTVRGGLPPLPRPGEGDLETGLRAYVEHGVALHLAILPAFAGLVARPGVLARLAGLDEDDHQDDGGLRVRLTDFLRAEQAAGRVAADADPEAAATMVVGACHELVLPPLLSGVPVEEIRVPPGFAGRVVATCLHGLVPR
ncbi:TetR/AcrR family transcriptional regulator [Nonomuraea sp. NPDC048826]|uniref:TetR/AcrR family transcriptional regulator n=1 Tax=Nonomuraea sp. NPDC048826 TaxID=3364347 RepID=UPI00371828E3